MIKTPFWLKPDYIEKQSLYDSIKLITKIYPFKGRLLDIGCGNKPYEGLFKNCDYMGIDFKKYSANKTFHCGKPDIFFLENYKKNFVMSNIPNQSLDVVVSFQVLEHHKKPEIFFKECSRILKPGGYLLITVPFVWELHEEPNDYYRFTEYIINNFCDGSNLKLIETIRRKGVFCVVNQIVNNKFLKSEAKFFRMFASPLVLLQHLSYFLDDLIKDHKIFLGYIFLIKKPLK